MQQATIIPVDYKSLFEASQLQVMQLTLRIAQLEKMLFGSWHERFVPDNGAVAEQLALRLQAEAIGERTVSKAIMKNKMTPCFNCRCSKQKETE